MGRLSYTHLVMIDIYKDKDREELVEYLKDIQEDIEEDLLQGEVSRLISILEHSTDEDYTAYKKEAAGMNDADVEEELDTYLE